MKIIDELCHDYSTWKKTDLSPEQKLALYKSGMVSLEALNAYVTIDQNGREELHETPSLSGKRFEIFQRLSYEGYQSIDTYFIYGHGVYKWDRETAEMQEYLHQFPGWQSHDILLTLPPGVHWQDNNTLLYDKTLDRREKKFGFYPPTPFLAFHYSPDYSEPVFKDSYDLALEWLPFIDGEEKTPKEYVYDNLIKYLQEGGIWDIKCGCWRVKCLTTYHLEIESCKSSPNGKCLQPYDEIKAELDYDYWSEMVWDDFYYSEYEEYEEYDITESEYRKITNFSSASHARPRRKHDHHLLPKKKGHITAREFCRLIPQKMRNDEKWRVVVEMLCHAAELAFPSFRLSAEVKNNAWRNIQTTSAKICEIDAETFIEKLRSANGFHEVEALYRRLVQKNEPILLPLLKGYSGPVIDALNSILSTNDVEPEEPKGRYAWAARYSETSSLFRIHVSYNRIREALLDTTLPHELNELLPRRITSLLLINLRELLSLGIYIQMVDICHLIFIAAELAFPKRFFHSGLKALWAKMNTINEERLFTHDANYNLLQMLHDCCDAICNLSLDEFKFAIWSKKDYILLKELLYSFKDGKERINLCFSEIWSSIFLQEMKGYAADALRPYLADDDMMEPKLCFKALPWTGRYSEIAMIIKLKVSLNRISWLVNKELELDEWNKLIPMLVQEDKKWRKINDIITLAYRMSNPDFNPAQCFGMELWETLQIHSNAISSMRMDKFIATIQRHEDYEELKTALLSNEYADCICITHSLISDFTGPIVDAITEFLQYSKGCHVLSDNYVEKYSNITSVFEIQNSWNRIEQVIQSEIFCKQFNDKILDRFKTLNKWKEIAEMLHLTRKLVFPSTVVCTIDINGDIWQTMKDDCNVLCEMSPQKFIIALRNSPDFWQLFSFEEETISCSNSYILSKLIENQTEFSSVTRILDYYSNSIMNEKQLFDAFPCFGKYPEIAALIKIFAIRNRLTIAMKGKLTFEHWNKLIPLLVQKQPKWEKICQATTLAHQMLFPDFDPSQSSLDSGLWERLTEHCNAICSVDFTTFFTAVRRHADLSELNNILHDKHYFSGSCGRSVESLFIDHDSPIRILRYFLLRELKYTLPPNLKDSWLKEYPNIIIVIKIQVVLNRLEKVII